MIVAIFREFIGGAYKDRSPYLNPQTCVNLFPAIDQHGGKHITSLIGTPGLKPLAQAPIGGPVRGLLFDGSNLYAVISNRVYKIDVTWSMTEIGTVGTVADIVQMAHNGTQIMLIDGSNGYIYDTAAGTFAEITDPDFPTPSSLTYQDGYFIVSELGTDKFYISALLDGTSWDPLDFASAEAQPDAAVAIFSDHRELWIFGEETTEVYYNSGNADFPFERISGAIQQIGCGAKFSVAAGADTLFWFDNRGFVVKAIGYQHQIVSTRHLEYEWSTYQKTSDAIGIVYNFEGHVWYTITFPTGNKTWVYDDATGLWHERRSYSDSGSDHGRHRMMTYAKAWGKHIAGDYSNGKIYEIDIDTYTDNGNTIIRERTGPVISNENKRLFFREFQIDFEPGVGITSPYSISVPGVDPQAMLSWSDDGGMTWSSELLAPIGKTGEYQNRAIWRQLGTARNRVFRVRVSDPVKVAIAGAYLRVEQGAF